MNDLRMISNKTKRPVLHSCFAMARRSLLLLCLFVAFINAKVINTIESSSFITKVSVGISQSLQWLTHLVTPNFAITKRPPRTVKLAIVGLGRTKSTSFSASLKYLGYAPIHDDEVLEVSDIYGKMMDGSMTMDQVNDAIGQRGFDTPMISTHDYVKWLAARPDIKVILTVLDPQQWAESWVAVTPAALLPEQRPFRWIPSVRHLTDFTREIMLNVPTNGHPERFNDVTTLFNGYRAWTKFVLDTIPPERLLVFNVQYHGWVPLCKFLDKPIPSVPFPLIDDQVEVSTIIAVFQVITWIWPLLFAFPFIVAYYCWRRRQGRRRQSPNQDSTDLWDEPKKQV